FTDVSGTLQAGFKLRGGAIAEASTRPLTPMAAGKKPHPLPEPEISNEQGDHRSRILPPDSGLHSSRAEHIERVCTVTGNLRSCGAQRALSRRHPCRSRVRP